MGTPRGEREGRRRGIEEGLMESSSLGRRRCSNLHFLTIRGGRPPMEGFFLGEYGLREIADLHWQQVLSDRNIQRQRRLCLTATHGARSIPRLFPLSLSVCLGALNLELIVSLFPFPV